MSLEISKTDRISSWGGVRVGAGRKPKLQYEARELFNSAVDLEWPYIMEMLLNYARKGDKDVLKWIVEQRIGKAPQSMDVNSNSAVLNVNEVLDPDATERVMEIAKRVSEELKKTKTSV
jgi:hypothetical protein